MAPLPSLPDAPIDEPVAQISVAAHHRGDSWRSLPRSAVRSEEAASAIEFTSIPSDSLPGADLLSSTRKSASWPEVSTDEVPTPEIALIASEPTHSSDLAHRIATLLRDSAAPTEVPPAGATKQPQPLTNQVTG
jgi:hypothetical protein